MNFNILKEYVVIVNEGSGCIFQPLNNDYSYILTAKHNIENAQGKINQLIRFEYNGNNWSEIQIFIDELVENKNYFPHKVNDIAILKVEKINGHNNLLRLDNIDEDNDGFLLAGYPNTRRIVNPELRSNWFRIDEGVQIYGTYDKGMREGRVPGHPGIEEIKGISGGCIFKIRGEFLLLAGIQNKMMEARNEQLGAIKFTPIKCFDEIIKLNSGALSDIIPPYLKCFSFLQDDSFQLEVDALKENDIAFAKNYLKGRTKNIVQSTTTPIQIKDFFKSRLLINGENQEILQTKNLWIVWLEFLTILNIIKYDTFDREKIFEIFDSARLLFSSTTKDWTYELQNIIYSDYKGLKENGLVVIGTNSEPKSGTYEIEKLKIVNIWRGIDKGKMRTNEGIINPFDHYKFVHSSFFTRKCIIEKHLEYVEIIEDDILLDKLKNEYGKLFKTQ